MTLLGRNGAPSPDPDADCLGAAWDDLVTDRHPDPDNVDPDLLDVVRSLHRGAPKVLPDERFTTSLKEMIMTSAPSTAASGMLSALPARELPLPSRPDRPIVDLPRSRPVGRWFPVLVSAALLVLTLGVAIGQFGWGRDDPERGPGGLVIQAPGSPSLAATSTDEPVGDALTPTPGTAAEFEGTWLLTATSDGQISRHVVSLTADGVAVVNGMPVVPLPGGESGVAFTSTGLGAWEPSASNSANITYVRYRANAEGQPLGTVAVSMNITVGLFNSTQGTGTGVTTITDAEGTTVATIVSEFSLTKLFAQAPMMPDLNLTPTP